MAKVLLFGATGHIGFHLAQQLALAGVQTVAAVRNLKVATGDRKTKLVQLEQAGVELVEASADDDTQDLVKLLKSSDTVVTAFSGLNKAELERKVIEAARQAGTIKRYVQSEYGGEFPIEGKHADITPPAFKALAEQSKEVRHALTDADIAYTKLVPYAFAAWVLPAWGAAAFPGTPSPAVATIYGDGNVRGAITDEADIGKVLAQVVNDSRTLNKKVIIKTNTLTQLELLGAYERISNKTVPRKIVTREELDEQIKGADPPGGFLLSLNKLIWFDGALQLPTEELNTDDPVFADQLYPDIHLKTAEEWYTAVV